MSFQLISNLIFILHSVQSVQCFPTSWHYPEPHISLGTIKPVSNIDFSNFVSNPIQISSPFAPGKAHLEQEDYVNSQALMELKYLIFGLKKELQHLAVSTNQKLDGIKDYLETTGDASILNKSEPNDTIVRTEESAVEIFFDEPNTSFGFELVSNIDLMEKGVPLREECIYERNTEILSGHVCLVRNGRMEFVNGNLFIRDRRGNMVWSVRSIGDDGNRLMFQADGNLVLYTKNGMAKWAAHTHERGNKMIFHEDRDLVIYDKDSKPIWASITEV